AQARAARQDSDGVSLSATPRRHARGAVAAIPRRPAPRAHARTAQWRARHRSIAAGSGFSDPVSARASRRRAGIAAVGGALLLWRSATRQAIGRLQLSHVADVGEE